MLIPTNAAVEALPPEVRAFVSNPAATSALLAYHTLEGARHLVDLTGGQQLPTFARDAQVGAGTEGRREEGPCSAAPHGVGGWQ